MGKLSLWEKVVESIGTVAFHVFLWSSNISRAAYIESAINREVKARQAFISIGGKMPACYRLVKSGWAGMYHLLYEDPERCDHYYEHYFVGMREIAERFPFVEINRES